LPHRPRRARGPARRARADRPPRLDADRGQGAVGADGQPQGQIWRLPDRHPRQVPRPPGRRRRGVRGDGRGFAPLAARAGEGDPTLGLPLRLHGETRHGTLFAINEAHLSYIENYVRDPLRRETVEPGGIRNQSIASRLPRWVKAAKNRDDVLKLIERMRARLL